MPSGHSGEVYDARNQEVSYHQAYPTPQVTSGKAPANLSITEYANMLRETTMALNDVFGKLEARLGPVLVPTHETDNMKPVSPLPPAQTEIASVLSQAILNTERLRDAIREVDRRLNL